MRLPDPVDSAVDTPFTFGTKGETLAALRALVTHAQFCDQHLFSVSDWRANHIAHSEQILSRFGQQLLAVRSSARAEDTASSSMAGVYDSAIRVTPDPESLAQAVEAVIASYGSTNYDDQILVQPMVEGVDISGVVVTREVSAGGPYYVINYDDFSGRTDTVTGGAESKSLLVHREHTQTLQSARFNDLLIAVQEIEDATNSTQLDIEFCIDKANRIFVLQVRPLTMQARWSDSADHAVARELAAIAASLSHNATPAPDILGAASLYSNMADWNPAEMIGSTPRPLATSLYQHLITNRTWCIARQAMGYRKFNPQPLLRIFGGRPFVDVRLSFNSLIPDGISDGTATALIDRQLSQLEADRAQHDKVEFEFALSCMDFNFQAKERELLAAGFRSNETDDLRQQLTAITNAVIADAGRATSDAVATSNQLTAAPNDNSNHSMRTRRLLANCIRHGTYPFSIVARHAFIAVSLVKSLVHRGILAPSDEGQLMESIETVTVDIVQKMHLLSHDDVGRNEFLADYGHLRPGTYDIMSPRYDEQPDLYLGGTSNPPHRVAGNFALTPRQKTQIQTLCDEADLRTDPDALLAFIHGAVAARELVKLRFSKNISDALATITGWGAARGLDADSLSYLTIDEILDPPGSIPTEVTIAQRRHALDVASTLRLPDVIAGPDDVHVIRMPLGKPTFISRACVTARTRALSMTETTDLTGVIVLIEAADPGYDWIFSHPIAGLITKFGGANSHIAIRCAEFGLPAAIGCGERLFNELAAASTIEINCEAGVLRPLSK